MTLECINPKDLPTPQTCTACAGHQDHNLRRQLQTRRMLADY